MKLEPGCIKSVLEAIESSTSCYESFIYDFDKRLPDKLKRYSHEQIVYHIQYCNDMEYLKGCSILGNGAMVIVEDLTPAGHNYLKNLRSRGFLSAIADVWEEKKREGISVLITELFRSAAEFLIFRR